MIIKLIFKIMKISILLNNYIIKIKLILNFKKSLKNISKINLKRLKNNIKFNLLKNKKDINKLMMMSRWLDKGECREE